MSIEDRTCLTTCHQVVRREDAATELVMSIHEGRNRQVRRMFEAVGHRVLALRRVSFGPLRLGELERGQYRELTREELAALRKR